MWIALGQQSQMGGKQLQPVYGSRRVEQSRRIECDRFSLERAKMLIKPRPPGQIDSIACLQDRLHTLRPAAPHEPKMPAVAWGHSFQDYAGLAVLARTQNDAFVLPLHQASFRCSAGKFKSDFPVALRIGTPVLAYFDKQK